MFIHSAARLELSCNYSIGITALRCYICFEIGADDYVIPLKKEFAHKNVMRSFYSEPGEVSQKPKILELKT